MYIGLYIHINIVCPGKVKEGTIIHYRKNDQTYQATVYNFGMYYDWQQKLTVEFYN